ncbi:tetratricopeptide repeat protein [Polluticaenibacter yanchengensis]|uniref:Tetratricopeptide repeat protein n=1 Tax=Polluticaenibacter yanchengensis TaxID=3014562 RepID=A0ABT4UIZ5_9BACT|nr:tetratricopeptide repeat protein [Chitinophagaceae bacterium LY-5]
MKKPQLILIGVGIVVLAGLYFLVPESGSKKNKPAETTHSAGDGHNHDEHDGHDHGTGNHTFSEDVYLSQNESKLTPERQQYLAKLKESVIRGDVKTQDLHTFHQLAKFWKDSVPNPFIHFYYTTKAAELENTEKSLTFAAQSVLKYLPYVENGEQQKWLANSAKSLFDKALTINAKSDSLIIGSSACLIYGADAGGEGLMQGIMKIREVAQRDSTNMYAQYMLGIASMTSGQFDKAIARFETVAKSQPTNVELLFKAAESCELARQYGKAIDWYKRIIALNIDPQMKPELEKRIKELETKK